MTIHDDEVQFDVRGDIFEAYGRWRYDTDNEVPGTFSLNVSNGSGEWVDFAVSTEYPTGLEFWTSGHLQDSESATVNWELRYHVDKVIKVKRWRPGAFRIPGDGGGDVRFQVPIHGDLTVNVSCIG